MKKRFLVLAMVMSMTLCACGAPVEENVAQVTDVEEQNVVDNMDEQNADEASDSSAESDNEEVVESDNAYVSESGVVYTDYLTISVAGEEWLTFRLPDNYTFGVWNSDAVETMKAGWFKWFKEAVEQPECFAYESVEDDYAINFHANNPSYDLKYLFAEVNDAKRVEIYMDHHEDNMYDQWTVEGNVEFLQYHYAELRDMGEVKGQKSTWLLYNGIMTAEKNGIDRVEYWAFNQEKPWIQLKFLYDMYDVEKTEYEPTSGVNHTPWTDETVVDLIENGF